MRGRSEDEAFESDKKKTALVECCGCAFGRRRCPNVLTRPTVSGNTVLEFLGFSGEQRTVHKVELHNFYQEPECAWKSGQFTRLIQKSSRKDIS
jgi:hypothetical protein